MNSRKMSEKLMITVRRMLYAVIRILDVLFPIRKNKLVIFSYHSIARDEWRFSIDPDQFQIQINKLLEQYQPTSLSEALEFLRGNRVLDRPSFVLTFDDGYRDIVATKDFLGSRGIRPAFFVLSDPNHADSAELGTKREFLSDGDICELITLGWEIGSHSATHCDFWSIDASRMESEIAGSKRSLEERVGSAVRFFAYPRGRYTEEAKRKTRESGYELALSMDDGYLSSGTDLFAVPRIGVDRTHSIREFSSIHLDVAIAFRKLVKILFGRYL